MERSFKQVTSCWSDDDTIDLSDGIVGKYLSTKSNIISRNISQDLRQEARLHALKVKPKYKPGGHYPAFIKKCIVNKLNTILKSLSKTWFREVPSEVHLLLDKSGSLKAMVEIQLDTALIKAALSNRDWDIIFSHAAGETFAEIGKRLGVSKQAIAVAYNKALGAVRRFV